MLSRLTRAFIAMSVCSTAAFSQTQTLKSMRSMLVYPEYSNADKQLVADQAFLLAEQMYVHRALKMKAFGPEIDAVERLRTIKQVATSMTAEQLNDSIARVFLDQRDLHFNYNRPSKLACWASWIPVSFSSVLVGNKPTIVAEQVDGNAKKAIPALAKIQLGDRLLSYDSMTTEDALKVAAQMGAGANDDAQRSRAIEKLSVIAFSSQKIPARDTVSMIFAHQNGDRYAIDVPWLMFSRCNTLRSLDGENPIKESDFDQAKDDYQLLYKKIFPRQSFERNPSPSLLGLDDLSNTADKTVHKGIVHTSSGHYGFLQLDSFVPSLSTDGVLREIRKILTKDFADTDGLIIDLRDNGGGSINYADMLVQMFGPSKIQPTRMRILATPLNEQIFVERNMGDTNEWIEALREARIDHKPYATPLAVTTDDLANSLGQSWFKPVAVLTNSNCYSACDLFAASMQDHNIAIVIGEDHTTGAGGANVMEHQAFVKLMANSSTGLAAMPYGQNMRVSWRQAVRAGKHEGEVIENTGIISDVVIPRVEEDLYHNEAFLMEKIGAQLATQRSRYLSSVVDGQNEILFDNGKDAKWTELTKNTEVIEVTTHNTVVARISIKDGRVPTGIEIPGSAGFWTRGRFQLVGFTSGRRVWRVWRDVRWVGTYDALDPEKPLTTDFANGLPTFMKVENSYSPITSGWQIRDGALVVGQGNTYDNNVLTDAYIPLNSKGLQEIKVAFDLKLKVEEKYDYFRVYARVPGTDLREELLNLTGEVTERQTATIKKLAGQEKLEIVLEFQSDGNAVDSGVVIDNLEVSGKK